MNKKNRIISVLVLVALILVSFSTFADDNADTGSGDTNNALKDKGYYRGSEFMYKISVFVGLTDEVDKNSRLTSEWKMIGNEPVYVKTSSFSISSQVFCGSRNKVGYINGSSLTAN